MAQNRPPLLALSAAAGSGPAAMAPSAAKNAVIRSDLEAALARQFSSFSKDTVSTAAEWFVEELGLPPAYFNAHPAEIAARHLASLVAARELARASGRPLDINIAQKGRTAAFFAARSTLLIVSARRQAGGRLVSAHCSAFNLQVAHLFRGVQHSGGKSVQRVSDANLSPAAELER